MPLLPSGQQNYALGKALLESWGFGVTVGQTINLRRWWSAGQPQDQADDINAMFADESVRAIVALAGGFSAISVLDLFDYPLIQRNPKPFIGMSDITHYQWAMLSQCGLLGFHGNTITEGFASCFADAPAEDQALIKETYLRLLTDPSPLGALPTLAKRTCLNAGRAHGRFIGGTLKRFVALAGTSYFLPASFFDGAILFLEDIGESIYDLWANLHKLKHLGVLDRIAGMVVGKLTWVNEYFDEVDHPSPYEAILDVVQEFSFPILAADDFGHQISMLPLVFGLNGQIDASQLTIEFTESATS